MTKRNRVGLLYFIIVIATLLLRVSTSLGIYKLTSIDSSEYFTCMVQILIFGFISIVGYILFSIFNKDENVLTIRQDFGIKKLSFKNFIRTIIIAILMIIASTGISFVWQIILSVMGYTRIPSKTDYSSIGILFKELFFVAVLPGVFEEISHRGLLYAGYKECGWKFVLVSGLLFSLMHQNIVQTGYTFFDGCIMALVMFYTGSIWPSIIIHFLNNAISVCSEYISQNGGPLNFINIIEDWFYSTTAGYVVGVLAVLLSFILIGFMFSRLRKDAVKNGIVKENIIFEKCDRSVKPLHKDIFLIITILIGIAATVFSLVWGIMR